MKITVMSQNLLCWKEQGRLDAIASVLRKNSPDIIGLQEFTPVWEQYLSQQLPEYTLLLKYRAPESKEAAPILFKTERFELLDSGHFWLSETPDVCSKSWDACCHRIAMFASLRCRESGKTVNFINTHLDHVSRMAQQKGIELVLKKAGEYNPSQPLFLTGDFNSLSEHPAYKLTAQLLHDTRLSAPNSCDTPTFNGFHDLPDDWYTIDYIFANNAVKPLQFAVDTSRINGEFPSDHFGIVLNSEI